MSKRLECFMKVPIGARLGYKTEPWNLNAYFLNIQFSLGQHFWRWRLGKLMNFSTAHFCGRKGRSHRQWLFVTLNLTTLHGFDDNSWRRRATENHMVPCHAIHAIYDKGHDTSYGTFMLINGKMFLRHMAEMKDMEIIGFYQIQILISDWWLVTSY